MDIRKDYIVPRVVEAARTHRRENYTAEEIEMGIENVNTGLRVPPKLRQKDEDDESGSDDDEDEDEEMEGLEDDSTKQASKPTSGTARSIDEIMRFMTTGLAPEDEQQQYQQGGIGMRR